MLKWLSKKRNQKGFTLIELVVVIAILGILAAIAIPRIGGFTDKAKEAADKELVAIVKGSVAMLVASGDIKGSGDIVITEASGAMVYTPVNTVLASDGKTALTADAAKILLDPLVGTTTTYEKLTTATVNISTTGEVTIK